MSVDDRHNDLEDDEQVRRESAATVKGKLWEELGLVAPAAPSASSTPEAE